jgi:hypothetical protein
MVTHEVHDSENHGHNESGPEGPLVEGEVLVTGERF